jgi:hypothetical protein
MRTTLSPSVPALALAIIAAVAVLLLGCCCCQDKRYTCRVCVAKPSCRYCVEGRTGSDELAAATDTKLVLCEGLVGVAVPGVNTKTAAGCVAEPEKKFVTQCREEGHIGGVLGGRVW